MTSLTRRQFLKFSLLASSALAAQPLMVACNSRSSQSVSPGNPTVTPLTAELPDASLETDATDAGAVEAEASDLQTAPVSLGQPAPLSEPAQPASETPHLVAARNLPPEDLVRRALDALGGMAVFVPKGAWVIIKPNICVAYHSYEYAATTNPWVVGALVKLA
jgi:hypothetical protein